MQFVAKSTITYSSHEIFFTCKPPWKGRRTTWSQVNTYWAHLDFLAFSMRGDTFSHQKIRLFFRHTTLHPVFSVFSWKLRLMLPNYCFKKNIQKWKPWSNGVPPSGSWKDIFVLYRVSIGHDGFRTGYGIGLFSLRYFLSMQVFQISKLAATHIITAFKKHSIKDKRKIFVDLLIISLKLHIIIGVSNMVGYQLSSNDLKSIPSKYICKQCGFVLREPMQTPCAHFYCRSCLEDLKR